LAIRWRTLVLVGGERAPDDLPHTDTAPPACPLRVFCAALAGPQNPFTPQPAMRRRIGR